MSITQKHLDEKLNKAKAWPMRYNLVCKDGFTVSVQASEFHYSSPRDNNGVYTHVELGFPTSSPGPAIQEYAENPYDLTGTVYGYVPIGLVDDLIRTHGGAAVKRIRLSTLAVKCWVGWLRLARLTREVAASVPQQRRCLTSPSTAMLRCRKMFRTTAKQRKL